MIVDPTPSHIAIQMTGRRRRRIQSLIHQSSHFMLTSVTTMLIVLALFKFETKYNPELNIEIRG